MAHIGGNYYTDNYLEDIHITEKEKNSEWYLKDNIDYWIANLVRERPQISTYRNYYNGVRNEKEFEYLTENFGIGTPSSVNFTPLIKPRIDALLSTIEDENYNYTVTCVDDKTIDIIQEEKKFKQIGEIYGALDRFTQSMVEAAKRAQPQQKEEKQQEGQQQPQQQPQQQGPDDTMATELARTIKNIKSKYGSSYLSDFEIAAQNVLKYFENEYHMDLRQKLKQLALDLLVTGECHYRVIIDRVGADPQLEVIKPENIFYNKNTNSQYFDTVDAVVHREFLTRKEILKRYGKFMSKEQKEYLYGDRARIRTARSLRSGVDLELYYEGNDTLWGQKSYTNLDVVEVFHVEWLALNEVKYTDEDREDEEQVDGGYQSDINKKAYRVDRYEGTRIAGSVYVNAGRSSHIVRSESRPYECSLTYNGIAYNDRNGKPFSMVGAMKDLQDVYDLTIFYRDNLIANSGVPGSRINIAGIPKQLGNEFMERLMKFVALKKNGFELIDPTEPGAQLFQHYGEFDNSVNGHSLQAINAVLQMMERQADLIAGTNPQMLGQIAERDAVGNVKVGIERSLVINSDLFELVRTNQKRLMMDLLNASKIAYSKGKKASYIVGAETYVFSIAPEKFSYSDYAISITYSSKDQRKLQDLKIVAKEFASNGMVEPDALTQIILSDSITEINRIIRDSWALTKKERDEIGQAQQQIEQLSQQLKQMEAELNSTKQELKTYEQMNLQLKERELQIKEKESESKLRLEDKALKQEKEKDDKEHLLRQETVQLEREQLYMGTGAAREPKNIE